LTAWRRDEQLARPTCALLVEDEPDIRRMLCIALQAERLHVLEAADGRTALATLQKEHVDIVVLDLMLPDIDGFEVCRRIRTSSQVPVVVVSARDDSHDIVAGLEAGADDYVVKPVVAKELAARLRAVLRRAGDSGAAADAWTAAGLEMRGRDNVVLRDGEPVALTVTESSILRLLAAHAGDVVTRRTLLEQVWGPAYAEDTRLLDVHLSRLRSKVEDDPAHPARIVTVRGVGYKLEP
jgi:DNA-binding response OmpR family regulator